MHFGLVTGRAMEEGRFLQNELGQNDFLAKEILKRLVILEIMSKSC